MRYEQMTVRQQRLASTSNCPICGKKIEKIEDVQFTQMRYGRRVFNFYIHSSCLLKTMASSQLGGVQNEKEENAIK